VRLLFVIIPMVLFLVLAVGHCVRSGVELDDDGYIVLRVADNLRSGNGMVFNPGERRDVTDSPLWVGLVLPFSFTKDAPFWVVACGLALGVAVLLAVHAGPRLTVAGACASLFLALDGLFAARATAGTSATFAALYVLVLFGMVRRWRGRTEAGLNEPVLAAWLAVAALVRYELVLIAIPTALGWALPERRRSRAWLPLAAAIGGALVCALARWLYFDTLPALWEPWPPTSASMRAGTMTLLGLVLRRPLLALGAFVLVAGIASGASRPNRTSGLTFGFFLLAFFAILPAGGTDVLRHAPVLLPLGYVLAVEAVWRGTRTRFGLVAALLLVAAQPAWTWKEVVERSGSAAGYARLGQWLQSRARTDTVVGAREVGALGYYSRLRMEDVEGQVSGRVAAQRRARPPVSEEIAARDFVPMLSLEPDLVVVAYGEPVPSNMVYVPNQNAVPSVLRGNYGVYRWAGSPVWRTTAVPEPSTRVESAPDRRRRQASPANQEGEAAERRDGAQRLEAGERQDVEAPREENRAADESDPR